MRAHDDFADLLQRLLDLYFEQLNSTVATLYPGLDDLLKAVRSTEYSLGDRNQ